MVRLNICASHPQIRVGLPNNGQRRVAFPDPGDLRSKIMLENDLEGCCKFESLYILHRINSHLDGLLKQASIKP